METIKINLVIENNEPIVLNKIKTQEILALHYWNFPIPKNTFQDKDD